MTGPTEHEVEERLRIGLARRAEHAPSGAAVLNTLAASAPARRRPVGLWLAVAAAFVAVVVGLSVGVRALGDRTPTTTPPPVPALTMTATWLPPGFAEWYRAASADGAIQSHTWVRSGDLTHEPSIGLRNVSTADPGYGMSTNVPGADVVLVRGHRAVVAYPTTASATVTWQPSPQRVLQVQVLNMPDLRNVAIRVADSVVPEHSTVVSGLAFGLLPGGITPVLSGVYGSSPGAGASVLTASEGSRWNGDVFVYLTSGKLFPVIRDAGTPAIVRGRSGFYLAQGVPGSGVTVQLPDGKWLTVVSQPDNSAPLSEAALVTIADGVTIGRADYSPLGR